MIERIYTSNMECIEVKELSIQMKNDTNGIAIISVKYPDYDELLVEAVNAKKPEKFLIDKLEDKDFKTKETTIEANVFVKDGEKVVNTDEAIEKFLNYELDRAINAVYKEENK